MPEAKTGMVSSGWQPNALLPKDVLMGGLMGVLPQPETVRRRDRVLRILGKGDTSRQQPLSLSAQPTSEAQEKCQ